MERTLEALERTTVAILRVLDGRSSLGRLVRFWGLVYVANLVGAALFAAALAGVAFRWKWSSRGRWGRSPASWSGTTTSGRRRSAAAARSCTAPSPICGRRSRSSFFEGLSHREISDRDGVRSGR